MGAAWGPRQGRPGPRGQGCPLLAPSKDAVVAALTIALEKILAFFSSFRAAPAYAEGLFLALTAPIRGFVRQIESAAEAARRFFSGDWAGALEAARMVLPWNALGSAIEDAKRKFAEGTAIIRERWGEARSTIAVLEDDLANAMLRISQAWSGSGQAARKSADEAKAAAEGAREATEAFTRGQERAKAGVDSNAQAVKNLTDAVDALRKRYELGDITLGQYLQSLQGLLAKWEPHLRGLQAGTDEWKRYADAVLATKRAIEEATRSYSEMTRYEQERRAPRDWSSVMTGPEVGGVEGWRDAILDTLRLGSGAFGRLMDQITALEARLARGGLSEGAQRELQAVLEVAQKTAQAWEKEIGAAIEREQDDMTARARALGENVGEAIAEGIAEGFSSAQNALAQRIQEELDTLKLDIPGGLLGQLEEDLAAARAAVLAGVVPESDLPQLLSTSPTGQRRWPGGSHEAGEPPPSAFLRAWSR